MSLIPVGTRLPALLLDGSNGPINLDVDNRAAHALLFVRDAALETARDYVANWEHGLPDPKIWDAAPVVITESVAPETSLATATARPDVWNALGIARDMSALLIADRWGIVYFTGETRTFSDLPNALEVEEWLRYLATQCPECGVIDEPGYGEWAA